MNRNDDYRELDEDQLDDATVEELLTGTYAGADPDLVELAGLLTAMSSARYKDAPPPSPALQAILTPADGDASVAPGAGASPAEHRAEPFLRRAARHLPRVAIAVGIAALVLTAAGTAGVLPAPVQRTVANTVRNVTPFEIPEPGANALSGRPPAAKPTTSTPGGATVTTAGGAGQQEPVVPGGAVPSPTQRPTPSPGAAATAPAATNPSTGPPTSPQRPPDAGSPPPAAQPVRPPDFTVALTGRAVVPAAGDPDGTATVFVDVDVARRQVCVQLSVSALAPPTAVHLHAAREGQLGPLVAAFAPPPDAAAKTCASVDREAATDVRAHPERYYLEVHNGEFPGGAVRGQLAPEKNHP